MSTPSQIFKKKSQNQSQSEIIQQKKIIDDNFSYIQHHIKSEIRLKNKPIQEQIKHLQEEISNLDEQNNNITKDEKQYKKSRLKTELMSVLRQSQHAKTIIIPEINQKIERDNTNLMLFVLKKAIERDQNREVLLTDGIHSCGFDSIVGVYGEDQQCLRFRTTEVEYKQLQLYEMFREQYLLGFKEKVSEIYQIESSEVDILDISEGSSIISFKIKSKKDIQNDPQSIEFLEKVCNGKVEVYNYFVNAQEQKSTEIGLELKDFDNKYNMTWDHLPEFEERGPLNHRYNYYFPKGCYGFGLNITKYGQDQNWIKMNGNKEEWRILFHGTKNNNIKSIIKTSLRPGQRQAYTQDDCIDEFGKTIKVGNGIYFSDQFMICIKDRYADPITVYEKQFSTIFMSRVNPKKIRQSESMKQKHYFVVNNSEDVRPYRVLIYEVK